MSLGTYGVVGCARFLDPVRRRLAAPLGFWARTFEGSQFMAACCVAVKFEDESLRSHRMLRPDWLNMGF